MWCTSVHVVPYSYNIRTVKYHHRNVDFPHPAGLFRIFMTAPIWKLTANNNDDKNNMGRVRAKIARKSDGMNYD